MRDGFLKHRCPGQECCRLLEAAEKTVCLSFLGLGFVVSQSVMLVERLFFAEQNAVSFERMCDCVCVVLHVWFLIIIIIIIPNISRSYTRWCRVGLERCGGSP